MVKMAWLDCWRVIEMLELRSALVVVGEHLTGRVAVARYRGRRSRTTIKTPCLQH